MAGLSVEALWRHILPAGTNIAAGIVGLDRDVTWPVTMRTRAPAFPHLKGGELALISSGSLSDFDPPMSLTAVIRSLAGLGAAGAAVSGEIAAEAIDLADAVGFPLLRLPDGASLAELENVVARAVVDRRTEIHQRGQDLYRRLTELAIEGHGVNAILDTLAELTGKTILLESPSFVLRAHSERGAIRVNPAIEDSLRADARRIETWIARTTMSASEPPTLRLAIGTEAERVVAPIAVRDTILGYLSIAGPRGKLADIDDLAASRGAAACTIDLARERAVSEVEDRLQTDLVEALVTGGYGSINGAQTRAQRLSFDLNRSYTAIVFSGAIGAATSPSPLAVRELRGAVEREIETGGAPAMVGVHDGYVIALVTDGDDVAATKTWTQELHSSISARVAPTLSSGVSRRHDGVEGAMTAYREAEGALRLGRRVYGDGQMSHFGELGLFRLLLSLPTASELEEFFSDTLGALADYDRQHDGELVRTLDAYFASLCSPTDAADRLHVHRNTLLYRLRRIEEIAGVDLANGEVRLALHLGLRVGDVLHHGRPAR
ncbi:MAG: PucR family transcriptional regulator [Chloroflexota bacterium]|nr:MAG: PucR family transcriptional regulator [Chloroflexota bacterium]